MKRIAFFLVAVFALVYGSQAQGISSGTAMDNFSLPDTTGKTQSLNDLRGKRGALVIFVSTQCPVVRSYVERINQLAADYQAKGIAFIGVNSNSTESLDGIKSNITEYGYNFPVLIDKGNVLADKLGASVTPEVFFIDAKNVLLYRGAIDNDRSGKNITENHLRTAFDASLSGKKVEKTSAKAFGCAIKRVSD